LIYKKMNKKVGPIEIKVAFQISASAAYSLPPPLPLGGVFVQPLTVKYLVIGYQEEDFHEHHPQHLLGFEQQIPN
jgi:hypothetical protein